MQTSLGLLAYSIADCALQTESWAALDLAYLLPALGFGGGPAMLVGV